MPSRRKARPTTRALRPDTAAQALAPSAAATRLAWLLAEQKKLLAKVAKRRAGIAALEEKIRQVEAGVASAAGPVYLRMEKLDREIHQLFAALLRKGRLPTRLGNEVRRYYRLLQVEGTISLQAPVAGRGRQDAPEVDEADHASPADLGDLPSAPAPAANDGQLKSIFRTLAKLLHPDRTSAEADAADRSVAMQEANRAYEDRDLAALLDLQRRWAEQGGSETAAGDETERRCQALLKENRTLLDQYRALDRQWRAVGQSPLGETIRRGGADPVADLVARINAEHDELVELRDFVRAFANGEISADVFLHGPEGAAFDELFDNLRARLAEEALPQRRRARR